MTPLDEIRQDRNAARKYLNRTTASILTTLLGELESDNKRSGEEITDSKIVAKCKKFVADLQESLKVYSSDNSGMAKSIIAEQEIAVLNKYIPIQLSESDIATAVDEIMASESISLEQKSLGLIMKQLKVKYDGCYDGTLASKIIKQRLGV